MSDKFIQEIEDKFYAFGVRSAKLEEKILNETSFFKSEIDKITKEINKLNTFILDIKIKLDENKIVISSLLDKFEKTSVFLSEIKNSNLYFKDKINTLSLEILNIFNVFSSDYSKLKDVLKLLEEKTKENSKNISKSLESDTFLKDCIDTLNFKCNDIESNNKQIESSISEVKTKSNLNIEKIIFDLSNLKSKFSCLETDKSKGFIDLKSELLEMEEKIKNMILNIPKFDSSKFVSIEAFEGLRKIFDTSCLDSKNANLKSSLLEQQLSVFQKKFENLSLTLKMLENKLS